MAPDIGEGERLHGHRQPRRKSKHFEILGRDAANDMIELRIELDGVLQKARPALDDDRKWASEARMVLTDFSTIPIVTSAGCPLCPQ